MERYIGIDAHASSCTVAVVGASGRRLGAQVVETNGETLVSVIKAMAGRLHVAIEEGCHSGWLVEVLSPHVQQVVVVQLGQRVSKGHKSDAHDAFGLAEDLRVGRIEATVYKGVGAFAKLRQLVKVHQAIVSDAVRCQNRLKAIYRSRGVDVAGKAVYGSERQHYREQLPLSHRRAVGYAYAQLDATAAMRTEVEREVIKEAARHPISRILQSCPGLGPIRVAQLIATVVSPERFRTRQQFWSYCGLGVVMRSSSDWVRDSRGQWVWAAVQQTRGLTRRFNRPLKAVFKGAATTVIAHHKDSALYQHYAQQQAGGTKPNLARLTLARKIAATVLALWKKQEVYREPETAKKLTA